MQVVPSASPARLPVVPAAHLLLLGVHPGPGPQTAGQHPPAVEPGPQDRVVLHQDAGRCRRPRRPHAALQGRLSGRRLCCPSPGTRFLLSPALTSFLIDGGGGGGGKGGGG